MRNTILIIVAIVVIFLLGLFTGMYAVEPDYEVRYDTTYVQLPPNTIDLEPEVIEKYLPGEMRTRVDTLTEVRWRTRIDTVLQECEGDSIKIRSYQSPIDEEHISGTVYSDVFGILLDQRLEYTLNIPHIRETRYRTPIRGLIGAEGGYRFGGDLTLAAVVGIRLPSQSILVRGDPFREEVGLSWVRTF